MEKYVFHYIQPLKSQELRYMIRCNTNMKDLIIHVSFSMHCIRGKPGYVPTVLPTRSYRPFLLFEIISGMASISRTATCSLRAASKRFIYLHSILTKRRPF